MGRNKSNRGNNQRTANDSTIQRMLNQNIPQFIPLNPMEVVDSLESDGRQWKPSDLFAPLPLSPFKAKRAIQYRMNIPDRVADRYISKLTVPAYVQNNAMVRRIVCARRQVRRAVFFAKNLQNKAGFGNKSRRYAWHSKIKCK